MPAGRSTFTGTSLSVVLPSPSSPSSFLPQLNTAPVEVTARLWAKPAAIPVTLVPSSGLTFTGSSLPFVLPLQSWPAMFQPQANTAPFELSARLWYKPPATAVTFVADEAATAVRIADAGRVAAPAAPVSRTGEPAGPEVATTALSLPSPQRRPSPGP